MLSLPTYILGPCILESKKDTGKIVYTLMHQPIYVSKIALDQYLAPLLVSHSIYFITNHIFICTFLLNPHLAKKQCDTESNISLI